MVNVLIGRFDMSIEVVALPPLTPLAPAPLSVRTSDFDEVHPMSLETDPSKQSS